MISSQGKITIGELACDWHRKFNLFAVDLYPEINYSFAYCRGLAEMAVEIIEKTREEELVIAAHYYQRPEIQELAELLGFVGDSLGLALKTKKLLTDRNRSIQAVWLSAVRFMGDTMKIVLGDQLPVYMPNHAGCSLVASLLGISFDHRQDQHQVISEQLLRPVTLHPVRQWLDNNPDGVVLSYMNSDPVTKALSFLVFTSRNAYRALEYTMQQNPGKKVLMLPDTFLANFALAKARLENNPWINPDLVEIFPQKPVLGLCHVHAQKINPLALDQAMQQHPGAAVLIHPECGCAVDCFIRAQSGELGRQTQIGSTEEMIAFAKQQHFIKSLIIATETGHVYTVRKAAPDKKIYPVSSDATCEFMKSTTLEQLYEAIVGHDDPKRFEVELPADIICDAQQPIERMLTLV